MFTLYVVVVAVASDVVTYIEANKFSKQVLTEKDLQDVMNVLVYDGKLEAHQPKGDGDDDEISEEVVRYRVSPSYL